LQCSGTNRVADRPGEDHVELYTIKAEPNGLDVTECPGDVTESRTYDVTVDLSTLEGPCFDQMVPNIAIRCEGREIEVRNDGTAVRFDNVNGTIENCEIRLNGLDSVGVDATANATGATIRDIVFHHDSDDPWNCSDLDTFHVGSDFVAENPTFEISFDQITTPEDPSAVEAHLSGSGSDPLLTGDCQVTSTPGAPLVLSCGLAAVSDQQLDVRFCGDGIVNSQFPGDMCDGGPGCLADCTTAPVEDGIVLNMQRGEGSEIHLLWNAVGAPLYYVVGGDTPQFIPGADTLLGTTTSTTFVDESSMVRFYLVQTFLE